MKENRLKQIVEMDKEKHLAKILRKHLLQKMSYTGLKSVLLALTCL